MGKKGGAFWYIYWSHYILVSATVVKAPCHTLLGWLLEIVSTRRSLAAMPSHQGPPPPPLLPFGIRILLLLLCGRALSIPVEYPLGSVQYPHNTKLREGLDAKVLILGAGVAGVTAAQRLESYGISDFLIVEAHHEVGGRLKSQRFGSPYHVPTSPSWGSDTLKSVEVGAQWIQGYDEHNPIWGLARKHGIQTRSSDFAGNVSEFLSFLPVIRGRKARPHRRPATVSGYTHPSLTFEARLRCP